MGTIARLLVMPVHCAGNDDSFSMVPDLERSHLRA